MIKNWGKNILAVAVITALLAGCVAYASTNGDLCEQGEHSYCLSKTEYYYGAGSSFTVSSCSHANYSHKHYYTGTTTVNTYYCSYCGQKKTTRSWARDTSVPVTCTVYDPGR